MRARVGRALIAIRDNETAARTMGVNLATYKTGAFALSAAYAGVAGALFVFTVGFVSPESFTLTLSFAFLAAIVVGGLATVSGRGVRRALHRLRPGVAVGRRRGAGGRDLRRGADRRHVRVAAGGIVGLLRSAWNRSAQRSTNGRSEDEVTEVAWAGDGRRAGAGAGGVRS